MEKGKEQEGERAKKEKKGKKGIDVWMKEKGE